MVQKYIIEGMREEVFVCCLSEIWNSILIWAHYANNYNGCCIEYDIAQVRERLKYNLYPALYEEKYIDITESIINKSIINMNRNTGLVCNVAKAEEWKYEKEWRIVEYREESFYFRKALKAVYLGENCSREIKEDIVQWAKDKDKEVYIVEASRTRYELERHRIN